MKEPRNSFTSIVFNLLILVLIYLLIHWRLPPGDDKAFFWDKPKIQWVDWLFWSASGVMLNLLSRLADRNLTSLDKELPLSEVFIRIVCGVLVAFVVLVLINYASIDLSGIQITLNREPAIGVGLAFIFGFYDRVANRTVLKILWTFLKRNLWKIIHPIPGIKGKAINEQTYVNLYVEPKLQRPYLLAASTTSGKNGHQVSMERLIRYKSAEFVGKAGFTLNGLRMVFIGDIQSGKLPEIIAHEASHVSQKYLSDSIEQETEAYITGVRVDFEVKHPERNIPDEPSNEWLIIEKTLSSSNPDEVTKAKDKAEDVIRKKRRLHPYTE